MAVEILSDMAATMDSQNRPVQMQFQSDVGNENSFASMLQCCFSLWALNEKLAVYEELNWVS